MKAKLINESMSFKRGIDPKTAMGTGIVPQIINYINQNFPQILSDPNYYNYRILGREEYKEIKKNACPGLPVKQLKQILKELDLGIPIPKDQFIGSISDNDGTVTRKIPNNPDQYERIKGPWIILSYNKRAYYRGECVGGEWNAKNLRTGDVIDNWYASTDDINTKNYRKPTEKEKIKYKLS